MTGRESYMTYRKLLLHQESDCLFEVTDENDFANAMLSGCDDVTDDLHFEQLFARNKENDPDRT